jgi:hypothetical protein
MLRCLCLTTRADAIENCRGSQKITNQPLDTFWRVDPIELKNFTNDGQWGMVLNRVLQVRQVGVLQTQLR